MNWRSMLLMAGILAGASLLALLSGALIAAGMSPVVWVLILFIICIVAAGLFT